MRHYNILPTAQVRAASLSKDALKRLGWMDWYYSHGENAEGTCRHFGLSKSVFYRWKKRYNPKHLQSLEFDPKTRRPHKVREMTTPLWIQKRIYDIRKDDPEKSKYEIQAELRDEGVVIGRKCIEKIIKRYPELWNTQHKSVLKKHRNYKISRVKAAYELREKALGSLVQIDTKYFTVLGYRFFLFSAIDCKSRLGFIYAYTTISSASGQDFVRRVREYFPFPIQAVNTDNGSEYLLSFHKEIESWGIPHYFTNPHCPKQNGRVERFHQTAEYEYFNYQDVLPLLADVREHCLKFNEKYNTKRYHQSLGYKTPMQFVLEYQQQKGGKPFSI
jgi:transposase InsO family protein